MLCVSIRTPEYPRTEFGLRISFQADGSHSLIICYINNGRAKALKRIMTPREFIYYSSGEWPSIYNKKRENLLEKHQILGGILKDSLTLKEYIYFPAIDSVWKIRYDQFAFAEGFGWSQGKYKPSPNQSAYLYKEYGVKNLDTDYFTDTNFWKIMRDVTDTSWINTYRLLP